MDFLENIGSGISKAASNVSKRTKDWAAITNLNSQNSRLEKSITEIYTRLGQRYYELYHENPDEKLAEFVSVITSQTAQIAANNRQIAFLRQIMTCPSCGAEINTNSAFCPVCGAKMDQSQYAASQQSGAVCPVCGAALSSEQQFCSKCGAKVVPNKVNTSAQNAEPEPVNNCPQCGKPLHAGAKFCSNCGYHLDN